MDTLVRSVGRVLHSPRTPLAPVRVALVDLGYDAELFDLLLASPLFDVQRLHHLRWAVVACTMQGVRAGVLDAATERFGYFENVRACRGTDGRSVAEVAAEMFRGPVDLLPPWEGYVCPELGGEHFPYGRD